MSIAIETTLPAPRSAVDARARAQIQQFWADAGRGIIAPMPGRALTSPIVAFTATTKPKPHPKPKGKPCRCNMSPHHGSKSQGGWLNTCLPGDKTTIHNKRRIRSPHGPLFTIHTVTPLLDGTGSGQVRSWVVGTVKDDDQNKVAGDKVRFGYRVRINWGQRKLMPPPSEVPLPGNEHKKARIVYYYAFSLALRATKRQVPKDASGKPIPGQPPRLVLPARMKKPGGVGGSGWIPAACLVGKRKASAKSLLDCAGMCMKKFDTGSRRGRYRKYRPKEPHHHLRCAPKSVHERMHQRYFTKVRQGKGADYVNRTPDQLSRCGYVNVCYNLPDLADSDGVNAGGVSCDTFPVGTPVHVITKVKPAAAKMLGPKAKKKNGKPITEAQKAKADEKRYRQVFCYVAVKYRTGPGPSDYDFRYGWIAKDSLGSGKDMKHGTPCCVPKGKALTTVVY